MAPFFLIILVKLTSLTLIIFDEATAIMLKNGMNYSKAPSSAQLLQQCLSGEAIDHPYLPIMTGQVSVIGRDINIRINDACPLVAFPDMQAKAKTERGWEMPSIRDVKDGKLPKNTILLSAGCALEIALPNGRQAFPLFQRPVYAPGTTQVVVDPGLMNHPSGRYMFEPGKHKPDMRLSALPLMELNQELAIIRELSPAPAFNGIAGRARTSWQPLLISWQGETGINTSEKTDLLTELKLKIDRDVDIAAPYIIDAKLNPADAARLYRISTFLHDKKVDESIAVPFFNSAARTLELALPLKLDLRQETAPLSFFACEPMGRTVVLADNLRKQNKASLVPHLIGYAWNNVGDLAELKNHRPGRQLALA